MLSSSIKLACSALYTLFPSQPICDVNSALFIKKSIFNQDYMLLDSSFTNQFKGMFGFEFVLIIVYLIAISLMSALVLFGLKEFHVFKKFIEALYEDESIKNNMKLKNKPAKTDLDSHDAFIKKVSIPNELKNVSPRSKNFTTLQSGILHATAIVHSAKVVKPPDSKTTSPIQNLISQDFREILNLTKLTKHQLARRHAYQYSDSLYESQQYISSPFNNKFDTSHFKYISPLIRIKELSDAERTSGSKLFSNIYGFGIFKTIKNAARYNEMNTQSSTHNPFNNINTQTSAFINKLIHRFSS